MWVLEIYLSVDVGGILHMCMLCLCMCVFCVCMCMCV